MDEKGRAPSWPDESLGGTVLARTSGTRTVLELHGEIDLAVVLATTPQLYALTASHSATLVADLRTVTFMDCSGLAMLVDVRSRALASGGTFTMVCRDPKVLRLLEITGLADLLAPVPTLDEEADGASSTAGLPRGPEATGRAGPADPAGSGQLTGPTDDPADPAAGPALTRLTGPAVDAVDETGAGPDARPRGHGGAAGPRERGR